MKRSSILLRATCTFRLSRASFIAIAQIDNTNPEWKKEQNRGQMEDMANQAAVKQVRDSPRRLRSVLMWRRHAG